MDDTESVGVADQDAGNGRLITQHLQCNVIAPDIQGGRGMIEGALDFGTGGVPAGVHDAPPGMSALSSKRPLARGALI